MALRLRNSLLGLPLMMLAAFFMAALFSLVYTDWLDRQQLVLDTTEHALADAARFVRHANSAVGGKTAQLEQDVMLHRSGNHVSAIALVDPEGRILFAHQPEWKGRAASELFKEWDAARFRRVVEGIAPDIQVDAKNMVISVLAPYAAAPVEGQVTPVRRGGVFILYDISSALEQVRQNNLEKRMPDLGLVLLLALVLTFWLQRSVIGPLHDITAASRRLTRGDLAARTRLAGSSEVVELGLNFNTMAEGFERELKLRNELSAQLQTSFNRLTRLALQVPGVIYQFQLRPDGHLSFPYISAVVIDHYGFSPEQLALDAVPLLNLVCASDRAEFDASIVESARTLHPWRHEFRLHLPNGEIRWHVGTSRPERLEDGSVLWHGFFADINERRKAEEYRRLSASVFETAGEAIMVADANGLVVMVNPAFSRITGFAKEEVLGKDPIIMSFGRHDGEFHRAVREALRHQGAWAGEVWKQRKNGEEYPEWQSVSVVRDATGEITHYVSVFTDLSDIRIAQKTAENLSWRDQLTGLANRALFLRQMDQLLACVERDGGFAEILLLDLDRFKDINEARGLAVGDALLQVVAERLGRALRPDDILARLNADEIAIILPRLAATPEEAGREALAVAEKLRALLFDGVELNGEIFHLDTSIGMAVLPETSGETSSDVLRRADMAMHRAKDGGGARSVFFEATMGDSVRELRLAVAENQLRLYLQPQVNAGGQQVGSEALVRWEHPERGLVPPVMFIPLAEATDLIVSLDRWVLAEVCRLLARLNREGRPLRISVNISPRHFRRDDFVDEIKRLLAASGADPSYLMLEVTESLVIGDVADVVAKMTRLTALGVHFSMDDFGTGYSSLAYLKRLPIHELKIDKSFIQDSTTDPNDAALVETILSVAQHLHLQVVAEGVETQEQADFLNARGNVIHQGYFFGRPEPVEKWLSRTA